MNPIAQKIRDERIKAKMSEKELAKKCNVAPSYIIQIESGKKIINEKTAETILAVFGERVGFDFQEAQAEEQEVVKKIEKKKEVVQPDFYDVSPSDQWAGALANIIKKFPVTEIPSKKIVGHKELPILNKKVEGIAWDKISFVKISDNEMAAERIQKGDTVLVNAVKEIQGRGIYLIEMNQKQLIRVVYKESASKLLISCDKNEKGQLTDAAQVKVLGKCIRVEFDL